MRIFIGIDLDELVRTRISTFIAGVSGFAPEARWVRPESLHVTLKFIGEQKDEEVAAIAERLQSVPAERIEIAFRGYGFFPTPRAARVFWIGIQAGAQLAVVARDIDAAVAEFGVPREEREYSPHLTLARAGGRSGDPKWRKGDRPNGAFDVLQKRLAAMPEIDFGTMTADKFVLYQSQLGPGGSKYAKLKQFAMQDPAH